jgi:hypothetical protein
MYHLKVCDFRNIKYAQIPGEKIPMQYVRDGAVLLNGISGDAFYLLGDRPLSRI